MPDKNSPNILGTEKIGRLLMKYSIPAIIATAASSLYNIIDRIFIGHGVGPMAISGLALTFPLMNLAAAFGSLIGVGAATMVSIRLGQRNREGATAFLCNAFILNIIISIVYAVVMFIFLDDVLYAFGASKVTLPYARNFMQIILAGNIFTHLYFGLNNIMRASGYPTKAMITTLLTVAVNLVLAPLFIFVFKWGIRGAATATVCAQMVGTAWVFIHFMSKSSYVHFAKGYFKLKMKVILDIFSIGMSNFLMLICATLVTIIMNISLAHYGGDYAIGAFGIINSIGGLFAMIVLGFNQGMQPIAGYNFGARQFDRVIRVFKATLIAGTSVTIFGFLLAEIIPHFLANAFTSDQQLIHLATVGMRISIVMFPIVGFQMVTTNFFQSIGKAKISIFLSLSRQVLFLIPALLLLPHFFGLNGVWAALPSADFSSSLITLMVLQYQIKKIRLA
ncbi:MAG: MATE family efflux transporter [Lentimicrobiaceae bacterium]|nr:MATE family efflux transporter [Lentimicrobiaceae bacterium]